MKEIEEYKDLLVENIEKQKELRKIGESIFYDLARRVDLILSKYGYREITYKHGNNVYLIYVTDLPQECDTAIINFYTTEWIYPVSEGIYSDHIFYKEKYYFQNEYEYSYILINLYNSDFFQSLKLKYDLELKLPQKEIKKSNKI